MAYIWNLRGILVSGTYMAIVYEVTIVAGFILVDMGKDVNSICPFSIMAVRLIFAMWQPYRCCNLSRGMI